MSHRRNEFEIEQTIFLGGQISDKHAIFKTIALMSPEYAEMFIVLENIEKLSLDDPMKMAKDLIMLLGQVDMIKYTTELTRLSMILGDTRKRYSMAGLKDELAKAAGNTS